MTPPKKRKTAVAKPAAAEPAAVEPAAADEPRQIRSRQAKAAKRENEAVSEPASPPKKSRAKPKSAVADAKNDAKSRPKRQTKKESENAAMKDDAAEEVVEKKTRGGKATEKAGMKATMVKPKAKVPVARKQKTTVENGDPEKNVVDEGPTKRTTRRAKAVEEGADAPVQPPVRAAPRKRKNAPDAKVIREAQVAKDEEEEENEAKVAEASKQSRTRAKKVETDTPAMTSKGRSKKNLVKEIAKPLPEEAEVEKENDEEQNAEEDNSKTKNVKPVKKGNVRKVAPKSRLNVAAGKANEAQAEEETAPELNVKENGEEHTVEPKQKKRNAGKANATTNGKVEAKEKQKKIAAAPVDEKEATKDVTAEIKTSEMNVASEIDENDTKDDSLSKDDSVLQSEEENKVNESANSIDCEIMENNAPILEISSNEGDNSIFSPLLKVQNC